MGLWQRGGALSGMQALARDAGLGEALGFCFVLGSARVLAHLGGRLPFLKSSVGLRAGSVEVRNTSYKSRMHSGELAVVVLAGSYGLQCADVYLVDLQVMSSAEDCCTNVLLLRPSGCEVGHADIMFERSGSV